MNKGAKGDSDWQSLDVFSSFEGDKHAAPPSVRTHGRMAFFAMLWTSMQIPLLLIVTGALAAGLYAGIDRTQDLLEYRGLIVTELGPWSLAAVVAYTSYCLLCGMASLAVVDLLCPSARGGGIPEIKCILSGNIKPELLSWRLVAAKSVGLILALSAGLSVGKEGPMIHVSCACADLLMRLPCFSSLHAHNAKRLAMLGCAAGAGVTAVFGTAYGGMLFTIELTSFSYMTDNLPRAFLATVASLVVFIYMGDTNQYTLFGADKAVPHEDHPGYTHVHVLTFTMLGVVCGVTGALFTRCATLVAELRNRLLAAPPPLPLAVEPGPDSDAMGAMAAAAAVAGVSASVSTRLRSVGVRRWLLTAVVVLIISVGTFMEECYSTGDESETFQLTSVFHPDKPHSHASMLLYLPYKWVVTVLSVNLPLPVGLFTPVFQMGGVIGHLVGNFLTEFLAFERAMDVTAQDFAFVGAAAFAAGVTRATSTAVIIYEICSESHLRVPIGVAIVTASYVAGQFSKGIYESLLDVNEVPVAPRLAVECNALLAGDIGIAVVGELCLTPECSYREAEVVLLRVDSSRIYAGADLAVIPVVTNRTDMGLLGTVTVEGLRAVLYTLGRQAVLAQTRTGANGHMAMLSGPVQFSVFSDGTLVPWHDWHGDRLGGLDRGDRGDGDGGDSNRRDRRGGVETDSAAAAAADADADAGSGADACALNSAVSSKVQLALDTAPFIATDGLQLGQVDVTFRMLKLSHMFIVHDGALASVISRASLRAFIVDREVKPHARSGSLLGALWRVFVPEPESDSDPQTAVAAATASWETAATATSDTTALLQPRDRNTARYGGLSVSFSTDDRSADDYH